MAQGNADLSVVGKTIQKGCKEMKFKPMQDRILLRVIEPEKPLVYAPEAAAERPVFGIVMAVGDGSRFQSGLTIPVRVQVGQKVMYEKHAGSKITVAGEFLLMIREGDVIGVFEDDVPAKLASVQ